MKLILKWITVKKVIISSEFWMKWENRMQMTVFRFKNKCRLITHLHKMCMVQLNLLVEIRMSSRFYPHLSRKKDKWDLQLVYLEEKLKAFKTKMKTGNQQIMLLSQLIHKDFYLRTSYLFWMNIAKIVKGKGN